MEKQPCVYMLASRPYGTLYIGVTSNLIGRLWQHRSGEVKGFTSRYGVQRLVGFELFGEMMAATAREKQLKRWTRKKKLRLIESMNPDLWDLAEGWAPPPCHPEGAQRPRDLASRQRG